VIGCQNSARRPWRCFSSLSSFLPTGIWLADLLSSPTREGCPAADFRLIECCSCFVGESTKLLASRGRLPFEIDDRIGVVGFGVVADRDTTLALDVNRRSLGPWEKLGGEVVQFGNVLTDELAVGVVLTSLLAGVVDSVGMAADEPALHLPLGVVDRGIGVDQVVVHEISSNLPPLLEDVAEKGSDHRTHSEVEPPCLNERTHRGVDHREPGSPLFPGVDELWIALLIAREQSLERGIDRFLGEPGIVGEFLAEVAIPEQPRLKEIACSLGTGALNARLVDLAGREDAEAEIG
jgi:hypothetical protein